MYTLSLHDALPISTVRRVAGTRKPRTGLKPRRLSRNGRPRLLRRRNQKTQNGIETDLYRESCRETFVAGTRRPRTGLKQNIRDSVCTSGSSCRRNQKTQNGIETENTHCLTRRSNSRRNQKTQNGIETLTVLTGWLTRRTSQEPENPERD